MNFLIQSLTFYRLISGPIIFCLLLLTPQYGLALVIFILASLSDYFDGYLARKYKLESSLGEILDPIADKILILFLLFALAIYFQSIFISFVGSLMLTREFWVSGLRDYNARNENISATNVSFLAKIKTTVQFCSFGGYLLGIFLGNALMVFISNFLLFASMLIAIYTAISYTQASFR